jgi:hypothetical protein
LNFNKVKSNLGGELRTNARQQRTKQCERGGNGGSLFDDLIY